MALHIEDYALISDCHSAALVGRDGSIDWLCLPRYDSASMFGALLGTEDHGRWLLAPADPAATSIRSYVGDTFILSTIWTTKTGQVEVLDFMPHGDGRADVVRSVRGISGRVEMRQDLRLRFGYATTVPWVRQLTHEKTPGLIAIAGPDAVVVRGPALRASDHRHTATFTVSTNEFVPLHLTWYPSHRALPAPVNMSEAFSQTRAWWEAWADACVHSGEFRSSVVRSLLVLRALTHERTGGIVAAATTSLPEIEGGTRNWDYRYVWLRDASLTLQVLLSHGYENEAQDWRAWLLRAIAGDPNDVQIMYGLSGERYLPERELPSLPGHRGAAPVRVGNGAVGQFQADAVGEVMMALHSARGAGVEETEFSWPLQLALMKYLEENWQRPDQGIWEVRGPAREFTHSRVMVWAAFDRAVRGVTEYGLPARWTGGGVSGTRCGKTSRSAASTRPAAATPSTSAAKRSTPRYCCCRRWASASRRMRACSAPCAPSRPICCATAWCCATARRRRWTASRAVSIRSWPVRSGWWSSSPARGAPTTPSS